MGSEKNHQSEDNILIVKGRFKSSANNLYGLFLLIFNNAKKLDTHHVIVSSYSDMYDNEPHTSWEKYEEYIVDKKWKGNFNNSMTASLMDSFTRLSDDQKAMKLLFDYIYNYDYDQMDLILYDLFNHIIHDKNLVMETIIQEITTQEFRKVKDERSKTKKDEDTDDEGPDDKDRQSVILKVKPILSPVKGKPIYELRVGDKIMIKLTPATSRENYYSDLYNLRENGVIRPNPATVIDIKSTSGKNNPVEILAEIMPGVYGMFIEDDKQIKLKLFDPRTDMVNEGMRGSKFYGYDSLENDDAPATGKSILIMVVLFVIILALFILLISISW